MFIEADPKHQEATAKKKLAKFKKNMKEMKCNKESTSSKSKDETAKVNMKEEAIGDASKILQMHK